MLGRRGDEGGGRGNGGGASSVHSVVVASLPQEGDVSIRGIPLNNRYMISELGDSPPENNNNNNPVLSLIGIRRTCNC